MLNSQIPDGFSLADTHIHSNFSDGVSSIKEILDKVEAERKLSAIAITDHNTIRGSVLAATLGERYSFDVIVGEEIMSSQGEIIGLFIEKEIKPGLSAEETIERIHEQDGLAVAPHLFVIPVGDIGGRGLWFRTHKCALDGFERSSGNPLLGYSNWLTRRVYGKLELASVAGSDAHIAKAVGSVATIFRGKGSDDLRRAIETRLTWSVRFTSTITQLLSYTKTSVEIMARHKRIMRESKEEAALAAERIFLQELTHFDGVNFGELQDRVLQNFLSFENRTDSE